MFNPITVLISGARGAGKSNLARRFANDLDRLGLRYVMFDGEFTADQRATIISQAVPDVIIATTVQPVEIPDA